MGAHTPWGIWRSEDNGSQFFLPPRGGRASPHLCAVYPRPAGSQDSGQLPRFRLPFRMSSGITDMGHHIQLKKESVYAHVSLCTSVGAPSKESTSDRRPGAGVLGSCESLMCWELNCLFSPASIFILLLLFTWVLGIRLLQQMLLLPAPSCWPGTCILVLSV